MERSYVPFYCNIITTLLHPLWCYLLIDVADLGVRGAGIAFTITEVLLLICLTVACNLMSDIKEAWFFSFSEACVGMKSYMVMAFYSAALVCLEFWSWNVFVFMSSFISVTTNSA